MDATERRALIERYRAGYNVVVAALEGVSEEELDTRLGPEEWTAREVVHHLGDSEMRSALRLRQLLAEDEPLIQGYDEHEWARRLHYGRPIGWSLDAFRAARASTSGLLDLMGDSDWKRAGTHEESGPYSAEDWLSIYAFHAEDHAEQIRRARAG
jgi:hypothetical protein